jgi:hypothetical protein
MQLGYLCHAIAIEYEYNVFDIVEFEELTKSHNMDSEVLRHVVTIHLRSPTKKMWWRKRGGGDNLCPE